MSATDLVASQGSYHDRNYFSPEPWEHFDVASGNLLLTFTDLELPGNAGRTLRFQRSYNNNGRPDTVGTWSFGIAGVPMWITDPPLPPSGYMFNDNVQTMLLTAPVLGMADGTAKTTLYLQSPIADGTMNSSVQYVRTTDFMLYDRSGHSLLMPDGTVARYEIYSSSQGFTRYALKEFNDPFGNLVTLTRASGSLTVTQILGAAQSRTVTYTIDPNGRTTAMSFLDRTWRYDWIEASPGNWQIQYVHLPIDGPAWVFAYDPGKYGSMTQITLPTGGWIVYSHEDHLIYDSRAPGNPDFAQWVLGVFTRRSAFDRDGTPRGVWNLEVGPHQVDPPGAATGAVTTPSGLRVSYWNSSPGEWAAGAQIGLNTVTLTDTTSGVDIETTTTRTQVFPVTSFDNRSWGRPEVTQRTITRKDGGQSRDYTTTYTYRSSNFADYHHPSTITETGDAGSRSTYFEYQHLTTPWLLALPTLQRVSSGSDVFDTTYSYDILGFRRTQVEYGVTTTFTPDATGNIATQTNGNNHTTSYAYSWGQIAQTTTPEYTTSRVIYPDGTVASETRGGRTTTYGYDVLKRLKVTQPPGGSNPTTVDYNDVAGIVTTHRGTSTVTTTMDGFGLPVRTENSVGVKTHVKYDAEQRKIYESYPFTGTFDGAGDIGTTYQYDALGRIARRINPGNPSTQATFAYGPGTVTITDENGHATTQTRQAFGNPDNTLLTGVTDAKGNNWSYAYNILGKLKTVNGPDGITRTWGYNGSNQLASETQPESGPVTYGPYDPAGNLQHKLDANGTTFDYTYDGNERPKTITATPQGGQPRVTRITYEAGTDNRATATIDGSLETTFSYDGAGRLYSRTDNVDSRQYTRLFEYDLNDNPSLVTYASGRRIQYQYDAENRITSVTDLTAHRPVATGFQYHASGAVTTFVSGNNVTNTINYDPNRYWVTSIDAGDLHLTYANYDGVGNVGTIGDARQSQTQPFASQTFTYDVLDRLHTANGSYGAFTYEYDAHGNRTNAGGSTYDYYTGTLRLWHQNGLTFTYDLNGNLKTSPNQSFNYTPDNQLETSNADGTTTNYAYDADGWRVKRWSAATISDFLRGARGELLTEQINPSQPSASMRDYVYAGTRLLGVVTAAGTAGSGCSSTVSPPSLTLGGGASSGTITVTMSANCPWTATKPADAIWISISPETGTGSGAVTYSVDAYNGTSARTTQLTIAGHLVPVTQNAAVLGATLQPGQRLYPGQFLTSANQKFHLKMYDSGGLKVYATTEDQELWRDPGAYNVGAAYAEMQADGNFVVYKDFNGGWRYQSGTTNHAGAHLVLQDDGNLVIYGSNGSYVWSPPGLSACTYTVSAPSFILSHGARSSSVDVTAGPGCPWNVVPSSVPSWLTITSGQNGVSNGTVAFSVADNAAVPSSNRQAALQIGYQITTIPASSDKTFVILQGGQGNLGTNRLSVGDRVFANQWLKSPNQQFRFILADAGTVSVWGPTYGKWGDGYTVPQGYLELQSDGHLVAHYPNGSTWTNPGAAAPGSNPYLVLQDDGNLVIYTQAGAVLWNIGGCSFALSASAAVPSFTASGGSGTVQVTASFPGCPWTTTNPAGWIGITSGQSGEGQPDGSPLTVSYNVAANTGTATRLATLTIGNQSFSVMQGGGPGSIGDRLMPAQRMYSGQWLQSADGRYRLDLNAAGALTLSGPGSANRWNDGHTPGSSYIAMHPNGNFYKYNLFDVVTLDYSQMGSPRVQLSGSPAPNSYLVLQTDGNVVIYRPDGPPDWWWTTGTAELNCTFSVSPSSMSVSAAQQYATFSVSAPAGCSWDATFADFVDIVDGWNGTGPGTVTVSIAANHSVNSRSATLTIAGQPATVNQAGESLSNRLQPNQALYPNQCIPSPSGTYSLCYQSDANLVLYGPGGSVRWSIYHVNPGYAGFALMHGTGTFAVYDSDGVNPIYVWDTQTNGHDGAYLTVEDGGYIAVWSPDGTIALRVYP